jgi:hypothetical protein
LQIEDVVAGAALGYVFVGVQGLMMQVLKISSFSTYGMIITGCLVVVLVERRKKKVSGNSEG